MIGSRVAAFATAFFVGWSVLAGQASAIVKLDDFCRAAAGTIFVFVDVTTRFADGDDRILRAGIERIVGRAQPGQRIRIQTMTNSFSITDVLFDWCLPRCSEGDGDCSDGKAKQAVPLFNNLLVEALDRAAPKQSLPASDIALTLAYTLRVRPAGGGPLAIYVFSDMLERSRTVDLVSEAKKAMVRNAKPRSLQREALDRLKRVGFDADLHGIPVTVFGFGREDAHRGPLDPEIAQFVRTFWIDALRDLGADKVEFHVMLP